MDHPFGNIPANNIPAVVLVDIFAFCCGFATLGLPWLRFFSKIFPSTDPVFAGIPLT